MTVGIGCAGTAGSNDLAATGLPWIGATFPASVTGLVPQSIALDVVGLAPLAVPLASVR